MSKSKVTIIGAGVSGLVAAIELEKAGYEPVIIEQSDAVGGRVRTENIDDVPYDRGFQVLLTAYPEAKQYLDYDTLNLVKFLPGSIIYKDGKQEKIGDPLRDTSFLWPTTFASIGNVNDKRKVLQLALSLKKKSIEAIFSEEEKSTLDYLKDYGFSQGMIDDFFQPFFAGIFLENELHTSSRMFEFVYKMFSTGSAAIPSEGMQAIPEQLASQLKKTAFIFNTHVRKIKDGIVHLENGETVESDYIIIATEASTLLNEKPVNADKAWKSCYNLYFEVDENAPTYGDPIIALVREKERHINNLHFMNDVFDVPNGKKILSVTVVAHPDMKAADLVAKVEQELKAFCDIEAKELVQLFYVRKALPNLCDLAYAPDASKVKLSDKLFVCGDHLANSSLNAAMASGRVAAEALIAQAKKVSA